MTDLLTSLGLGAVAFAAFLWIKSRLDDGALDNQFIAVAAQARLELSADDLGRLHANLRELREEGLSVALAQGFTGKQASRAMKVCAIQQMVAFMEIQKMFSRSGPQV